MKYALPVVNIIVALGASAGYMVVEGDWRRAIYWAAAAVITASVTF